MDTIELGKIEIAAIKGFASRQREFQRSAQELGLEQEEFGQALNELYGVELGKTHYLSPDGLTLQVIPPPITGDSEPAIGEKAKKGK